MVVYWDIMMRSQVSEGTEVEDRYGSNYGTTWEGARAMF